MAGDEACVGTWRSHKPRGPVAAMYGSPGPIYALPGLIGPIHLVPPNITRVGRSGAPAYSLHSRHKELRIFQTPGPGWYSPENAGKSIYYSPPEYTMSCRSKDFNNDKTPGPAAYMLPSVLGPGIVNKTCAPSYSLCGRSKVGSFHEDLQKYKAPQYSMTGRNSMPGDNTKKPGPGAHRPEQATTVGTDIFTQEEFGRLWKRM
ncbi:hypothetical protein CRUP_031139 [Coryphaenoides rupestris]|nr:hypothetical protein CRUP_031139 [Coryphaenoides rupestris]